MKTLAFLSLSLILLSCSQTTPKKKANLPMTLQEAVNSPMRDPENVKRDKYRHPIETLEFFGLKPDMTVVEITPGGGWYTEILAPYLAAKGQYIMAVPEITATSPAYAVTNDKKVRTILAKDNVV